ncbi:mandelate racemase/muconate lactonizing enzyme family protein [Polaromonas sp.]|uniref:mandelate racemase/muconate lactonizing enzyme family protein n=1 Tax=Polaromonas sp. TaxID=1869339 RepID=UPI003BA8CFB8
MHIAQVSIVPCPQRMRDASWKFARATVSKIDAHVLVLTDDISTVGVGYAHAIPAITSHGEGVRSALELLAPILSGRRLDEIALIMDEVERSLAFNYSVKAAIDMALHDLLARRLGVPINLLLGGQVHSEIRQSRILSIKPPVEMGINAAKLVSDGYRQLKLKLSGDTGLDVERVASVRDAVGPGVVLTLDPNQSYNAKQMMHAFARMERHDIALIEQPVPAHDWPGLALLTRSLPAAIEADESAVTVQDVYRLVTDRVVDVINLKVTKLGGFRHFMEAVRICEAGSVVCRVGAAFGPSLMQAMNAQAASTIKSLPYACELSEHQNLLDDPFTELPVVDGSVKISQAPGCGVVLVGSHLQ